MRNNLKTTAFVVLISLIGSNVTAQRSQNPATVYLKPYQKIRK